MLIPKNLVDIFHPIDDNGYEGEIMCKCGCKSFGIRCFGNFFDKNKLGIVEYEDKYGQAVKAICRDCQKEYLLYDFALNGYDGLICEEGITVPNEKLTEFTTETDNLFYIKMFLEYDDEEQFSEEILSDEDLQSKYNFTMDDRASIWTWVTIELRGVQSGVVYEDFVNEELA
ncbi:MAG: hypothetical protein ACI4JK_01655 [Oscillospiraceae bacterium]